jgi:hypothetical protein
MNAQEPRMTKKKGKRMSKPFLQAAAISLLIAFALPIVATSAIAVEKTDATKKKKTKKNPCGSEPCMKAAPVK